MQHCQALTVGAGGTCWGGSNLLPRSPYSPRYLGLILFSHLLPRTKKLLKLGLAGSTQWGTTPESFYRANRVQIRSNLPPPPRPTPPPPQPPSKTFCFSTTHIFQSSSFPIFFLQAARQQIRQAASRCGRPLCAGLPHLERMCFTSKEFGQLLLQQNRTYWSH